MNATRLEAVGTHWKQKKRTGSCSGSVGSTGSNRLLKGPRTWELWDCRNTFSDWETGDRTTEETGSVCAILVSSGLHGRLALDFCFWFWFSPSLSAWSAISATLLVLETPRNEDQRPLRASRGAVALTGHKCVQRWSLWWTQSARQRGVAWHC